MKTKNNSFELDLSELSEGLYIINIVNPTATYNSKVVR